MYKHIVLLFCLTLLIGACTTQKNILNVNLRDHNHLAVHIHPFLEIEIEGEKQTIPANKGIAEKGMAVIHTHDDSGKLHVESPYPHQFRLGDVFAVWGWVFNETQIQSHIVDGGHTLSVFVDGSQYDGPEPQNLPLEDGKRYKIVYAQR